MTDPDPAILVRLATLTELDRAFVALEVAAPDLTPSERRAAMFEGVKRRHEIQQLRRAAGIPVTDDVIDRIDWEDQLITIGRALQATR